MFVETLAQLGRSLVLLVLVTAALLAKVQPLSAQPPVKVLKPGSVEAVLHTPHATFYKIYRPKMPPGTSDELQGSPSVQGDNYSFEHQLGALIDGIFQCFSPHTSNMQDNDVLFDGITDLLDPYLDGTQPAVFEFESAGAGTGGGTDLFFNSFADADLFPEGFSDPETGTPLDAACLEIGIDDTLDSDVPAEVSSAMIEASGPDGEILPPTDITSLFDSPFDGRVSLVIPGLTGDDVDGMVLEMTLDTFQPQPIFSDGFESGDATAWSDQQP